MASQITGVSIVCSNVVRSRIKANIKAPRHWPLCGEFTGDRWIPRTKSQLCGKCFHSLTSSWWTWKPMAFVKLILNSCYNWQLVCNFGIMERTFLLIFCVYSCFIHPNLANNFLLKNPSSYQNVVATFSNKSLIDKCFSSAICARRQLLSWPRCNIRLSIVDKNE